MMKKVLIISYYFPPLGSIGYRRPLAFAKHLPDYGWKPFILTVKKGTDKLVDKFLIKEIPKSLKVYRTPSFEPFRYRSIIYNKVRNEEAHSFMIFFKRFAHHILKGIRIIISKFMIPDDRIGWLPYALITGIKIIKSKKIDAIYATSPPPTSLLIGCLLKMSTKKPLIVDYRDPWTFNPFWHYSSKLREKIDKWFEYQVIKRVDRCITITKPMEMVFTKRYSQLICGRSITITNGFDRSNFAGCRPKKYNKFTLLYSGTFYGSRNPECFLKALKQLKEENRDFRENSQFLFFGYIDKVIEKSLERQNLINLLNYPIQYLTYKKNYRYIMGADVLVLIMGLKSILTVPGKLFDYISTGKPILALAPKGAASDIIEETGVGVVVPPEDVDKIKSKILWFYGKYKKGEQNGTYEDAKFEKYSYSFLSKQLADLFDHLFKN